MRPVESLSHRQRELTPPSFARYLVDQVRERYGSHQLAALFVRADSPYREIEGVDCWDARRDAALYDGPWPVIAHPPCGPWGKYWHRCGQDPAHGLLAVELADRYGGVVEQPLSSRLFVCANVIPDAPLLQGAYGHLADKPTLLYYGQGYGSLWGISPQKDRGFSLLDRVGARAEARNCPSTASGDAN